MKAVEWAISIREDVRRVAAHPCIYGERAQCGKCATCVMRIHLRGLDAAKEQR